MTATAKLLTLLVRGCAAASIAALAPAGAWSAQAQESTGAKPGAAVPTSVFSGRRSEDVFAAQVLLDRGRHSPGVIDGVPGGNTARAVRAYERANGLPADGKVDSKLLAKLRAGDANEVMQRYTLTPEDVNGPFVSIPSGMSAMAKLDNLAFESAAEALAEKFHMSQPLLKAFNPGVDFTVAGTEIVVAATSTGGMDAKVARIEVDKAGGVLRAYGADDGIIATYPATIGSGDFPSPSGEMKVKAIAAAPKYYFDPAGREWGPDRKLQIAAGPNNPVGSTWIDLSKDGYGIHGTPDPALIGKTSSHGCVRLTNWDAEALSKMVEQGTVVVFV